MRDCNVWSRDREDGRGGDIMVVLACKVKVMKVGCGEGKAEIESAKVRRKMVIA